MLSGDATPIRPITGRLSLSPLSFTRTAFSSPCGLPAQKGSDTGLPCFTQVTKWVRPCLSADGHCVRVPPEFKRASDRLPFWFKPVSIFVLMRPYDVYQQFTCVGHATQPGALSASMLADYTFTSRRRCGPKARLRCPDRFTRVRYQSRMGR